MTSDIVTGEWYGVLGDEYNWSGRLVADAGSRGTMYASYDYLEEYINVGQGEFLGYDITGIEYMVNRLYWDKYASEGFYEGEAGSDGTGFYSEGDTLKGVLYSRYSTVENIEPIDQGTFEVDLSDDTVKGYYDGKLFALGYFYDSDQYFT